MIRLSRAHEKHFLRAPLALPSHPALSPRACLRAFQVRSGLQPVQRLRFPVVSIGNLSMGGSGKTPLTIALAKALSRRGLSVDVLSRGYGRQSQLAARVNPEGTAEEFGDEPLLIARETGLPVYVAPQRYNAGLLAEAGAPSISRSLRKGGKPRTRQSRVPHPCAFLAQGWETSILKILLFRKRTLRPSSTSSTTASSTANSIATSTFCSSIAKTGTTPCSRPAICANRSAPPTGPAPSPFQPTNRNSKQNCAWGWQGPVRRLRRTMKVPLSTAPSPPSAASPALNSSSPALKPPASKSLPARPFPTTTAIPPPISNAS